MWVPGRTNIKGNDMVDELARQGTDIHFIGPEPSFGVSKRQLKKRFQHWEGKERIFLLRESLEALGRRQKFQHLG